MKFEINLQKKYFIVILAGLLVIAGILAVNAYGTFNPEIFGHTVGEIAFNSNLLIPFNNNIEGSYKIGFEKSDGSYVYVGWEEDATPQLQIIGSEFIKGKGGGLEIHGDSQFVESEVIADDFCFENGKCLGDLEFQCTYAKRDSYNDPSKLIILDGDKGAVELWGEPEIGNDDAFWGLSCADGYKKTSCHMWMIGQASEEYDVITTDGLNCLTDDEEFEAGAVVSIGCCRIGF